MKYLLFPCAILLCCFETVMAQEYKVITSVESVVPMGLGRSRLITHLDKAEASEHTTERTDGTDSDQSDVRRRDLKIDRLEETKLLNFYSAVGINFQNIASNDAIISSKLTQMASEGWELVHVVSGVESDAGETDQQAIFITRYIFKR